MARQRMVTRTVELTIAEVMTLNVATAEVQNITYKMGGTYDKDNDILKALKKTHETADFKLVAIVKTTTESLLYGMPESKFIELAEIMPNR